VRELAATREVNASVKRIIVGAGTYSVRMNTVSMRRALHQHSTLAAVIASITAGLAGAAVTHSPAIAIVLAVCAMLLAPRILFGLRASRALDKARSKEEPGPTIISMNDMAGLGSSSVRLDRAYSRTSDHFDFAGRPPNARELERLSEEDQ